MTKQPRNREASHNGHPDFVASHFDHALRMQQGQSRLGVGLGPHGAFLNDFCELAKRRGFADGSKHARSHIECLASNDVQEVATRTPSNASAIGPILKSVQTHGAKKYPNSTLLKSSAGLGWSTIAAELRSHGVSSTPAIVPQQTEVILALAGNDNGLIRRTGAGQLQEHTPTTGSVSLTPIAVGDNEATFTAPIPATLHLYLPMLLFRRLSDDFNLPGMPGHCIRYLAGVRDEIINQVGHSIVSEMTNESAAGRMFVETASLMLAAHLLRTYCDSGSCKSFESTGHRLDHARLRRVLDYISVHLADEITVAKLASRGTQHVPFCANVHSRRGDFAQPLCQPIAPGAGYGRRSSRQALACANSVQIGVFLAGELHASVPSRNRDYAR